MKPIIGISSSIKDERFSILSDDNVHAISEYGGVPIILPNLKNEDEIDRIAETIDGLLLSGGGDIDPTLFGEEPHRNLGQISPERDYFEIHLARKLLKNHKPILAICRGCQILNIAAGGDMFQDIYEQHDNQLLQHNQKAPRSHSSHFVNVVEGSFFHRTLQKPHFKVNSFHHQAVRKLAKGFRLSAISSDGIIESFESSIHPFVLGVQWHPECMIAGGDQPSQVIFQEFVKSCDKKTLVGG